MRRCSSVPRSRVASFELVDGLRSRLEVDAGGGTGYGTGKAIAEGDAAERREGCSTGACDDSSGERTGAARGSCDRTTDARSPSQAGGCS